MKNPLDWCEEAEGDAKFASRVIVFATALMVGVLMLVAVFMYLVVIIGPGISAAAFAFLLWLWIRWTFK